MNLVVWVRIPGDRTRRGTGCEAKDLTSNQRAPRSPAQDEPKRCARSLGNQSLRGPTQGEGCFFFFSFFFCPAACSGDGGSIGAFEE